ncbi:MAG: MBL fold metallo-hydrolase [Patescibacteria group bacterium]|nr:MBL fold metallo-hydrolase [Patescibacteria group bacterium]
MKIIFLGTNGWYDSETGFTLCTIIDSKDYYIVLDAGNGIYKLDKYIKNDKPIYLFLSHVHIDHISGLHVLDKFNFKQGLDIYIPSGKRKALEVFKDSPYTKSFKKFAYRVDIHDVSDGKNKIPFNFVCKKLFHTDESFGYKFELDGKTITYSTDTGICENDLKLSENTDLLIHECTYQPGHPPTKWGHVTPDQVAKLAKDAGVKKLALTHFAADLYPTLKMRDEAAKLAKTIFKNTVAAKDGMVIEI